MSQLNPYTIDYTDNQQDLQQNAQQDNQQDLQQNAQQDSQQDLQQNAQQDSQQDLPQNAQQDSSEEKPKKPTILKAFKPAVNKWHSIGRFVVIIVVIAILVYTMQYIDDEDIALCDITDHVKPGTLLYKTIDEMDAEAQKKYLKSIKTTFDPDPPIGLRYVKSLQMALIAGIASEYIINGNLDKPLAIVPKTILMSVINTGLSFF